jgi:hypothetical protein
MIKYLRRTPSGAAGSGLGTAINYLRGTASIGLGTEIKYLRGAAGISLGTTANHLRASRASAWTHAQLSAMRNERRRGRQPGYHDQLPATHNERRRG